MSDTGWDIVAAATQGTINTALAQMNASRQAPISIDKRFPLGDSHLNVKLDCTFGALQIGALQQGETIVAVLINVDTGTLTLPVNDQIAIDGLQVQINMALSYVESSFAPESGTDYDLTIDFQNESAFSSIKLNNLPSGLADKPLLIAVTELTLLAALQLWVGPNGKEVVIATVNIGGLSSYPALVPTTLYYTFNLDEDDPDQTPFAVLIQTVSTQEGSFDLADGLIPPGSTASAAVSNYVLMSGLILPALQQALDTQSLTASSSPPQTITNTATIPFSSDGNTIDITSLSVSTSGGCIQLSVEASQSVWDGLITIEMSASAALAFAVGSAQDGSQTLSLVVQGKPDVKTKVSLPWWLSWATWILELLLPPIGVFVRLVEDLFLVFANALGAGVSSSLAESAVGVAIGQVQWNHADYMVVQSITLPSTSPWPLLAAGSLPSQLPPAEGS
jgi:hypothetical protein